MLSLVGEAEPQTPKPYEHIQLDLIEDDMQTGMQDFLAFLSLPDEIRDQVRYFDEQHPRTGHHGYAHKTNSDTKHVFHMTQRLNKEFFFKSYSLPTEARRFMTTADELATATIPGVQEKYRELEEEIPGIYRIHFPRSGLMRYHLRFIAYEDNDATPWLARGHYDKGSGTVALFESQEGLRLGFGEDDIAPLDRSRFDPVFFPGFGWHQLAEGLDVIPTRRAAWHDVEDVGGHLTDTIARIAIVLFIDPAHLYLDSTKEQTHTPIPWRGLGTHALRADNQLFNL